MVKRIVLGLLGIAAIVAIFWTARAEAADFTRPDCSAFAGRPEAESTCFRKTRFAVMDENYADLQKIGLEFVYLGRPVGGTELEKNYPEVVKAGKETHGSGCILRRPRRLRQVEQLSFSVVAEDA